MAGDVRASGADVVAVVSRFLTMTCNSKVVYATKAEAKKRQPTMRAYMCPLGHGYHVTSKHKKRRV